MSATDGTTKRDGDKRGRFIIYDRVARTLTVTENGSAVDVWDWHVGEPTHRMLREVLRLWVEEKSSVRT